MSYLLGLFNFESKILYESEIIKPLEELPKKIIKLLNYCRKTKNKKLEWRIY